jgi:parvulin-like peptidyl-prolyl isomerase
MRVIVNGEELPEADIKAEIAALRACAGELSLEQRMQLRDHAIEALIERSLIAQEVRRLNLRNPNQLLEHWGRSLKPPSIAQIRDYYREHRQHFWRPESVRASHFVKNHQGADRENNRAILTETRDRLLAGEDFSTLAAAHSDCPENGGDLGFFSRGVMVEEFDEMVFNAPVGQLTPIFETPFGLHIAFVHERRPEGILGLNEASPEIADALHRMKLDREVGIRLAELRTKARIEVI